VHDEAWPPRFTKLELQFEAGNALAFCDPRRLGRLRLRADPQNEEPWRSLAPDPLIDPIEKGRWLEVLAAKGCNIKALLLDQAALVSGVGNWVADEVLFHAGVHPESICRSLSDAQIDRLRAALTHVLNVAVSCGAKDEEFPRDWLFHYRWGKVPGTVPGERGGAITFLTVGGRTSAVVLSRQRKGDAPLKADAAEAGEYAAVKPKKQRGAKKEAAPAVEEPATGEGSGAARALEDELVAHWQGPGGGGSSSSKRKSRAVDVRAEEDAVGAVTGASGRRKKASKKAQ
jgi:formamidopyrimidine-DNA glycosylase